VPGASGGGRAPAGLGFGRCGRIGSDGQWWWIRRSTERGGPQGSRRRRGGLADCALGTVGGTSLVPLLALCRGQSTRTSVGPGWWLHRSNETRGILNLLYRSNLSTSLIRNVIVFFSHNKSALADLSAGFNTSRTSL